MKKQEISQLLKNYLEYYHLSDWKGLIENKSTRRFGLCNINKKIIKISGQLGSINPVHVVSRVIKHEVAHALAGLGHHHDRFWRNICIALGGDGKTKYTSVNTNTLYAKNSVPMTDPIIKNNKTRVFSWKTKRGYTVTITETYA